MLISTEQDKPHCCAIKSKSLSTNIMNMDNTMKGSRRDLCSDNFVI